MTWVRVLSNRTPVSPKTVGAFTRLAHALQATGHQATSTWRYKLPAHQGQPGLVAALHGIAIDADASCNSMRSRPHQSPVL
jgi:hypothetical protein